MAGLPFPRHSIDDVTEVLTPNSFLKIIVQLLKMLRCRSIIPNLEKLNPNLPWHGLAFGTI